MCPKKQEDNWWPFIWSTLSIIGLIALVAAIIFPIFVREHIPARKPICQSNMKELGLAIQLYCGDYDGMMPSSMLYGGSKTWNKSDFVHFAKERGTLPPPINAKSSTWPMLLYDHMMSKEIIWCPSDPSKSDNPSSAVSYYWKAAVDRAWYGDNKLKARKESDFTAFPENQVIFYENRGRHWDNQDKGLVDGVTINCVFMDGHVAPKMIINSGYTAAENPPEPLPKSGVGEPAWFNYNFKAKSGSKGAYWNPQVWGDDLR